MTDAEKPIYIGTNDKTPDGVLALWEKLTGKTATAEDRKKVEAILGKK